MWVREMEKYVYELKRGVTEAIQKDNRAGAKVHTLTDQTWARIEINGYHTQTISSFVSKSQFSWFYSGLGKQKK